MDKDLLSQKRVVSDEIHEMLKVEGDSLKVVVEIPKGFLHLSLYLRLLESNRGKAVSDWTSHKQQFDQQKRLQLNLSKQVMVRELNNTMHDLLHSFSTNDYWALFEKDPD